MRRLTWDEKWYRPRNAVHALDLSAAVANLYEKVRSGDDALDRDDATWTISRIYGADEAYLTWLLAGEVGA